jgi:hypothetical protein
MPLSQTNGIGAGQPPTTRIVIFGGLSALAGELQKKGSNFVYGGFAHREPNGNQVAEWEQILRLAPGDQAVRHELMRVGRTLAHVGG